MFYFKLPVIDPLLDLIETIKKITTVTIKYVNVGIGEKYVNIYGGLCENIRKIILNLGIFNFLQLYDCELRLIENKSQRVLFIGHRDFLATDCTKNELEILRGKDIILGDGLGEALENYILGY